ncbi:hypothetical protein A2154_01740 [Candidatus Gottesmanbacteria bacterium RBG_16_43_7]|uniref:Glycosyltransferase RgtA/B/C/D-like domain-containing protein n=1 Tax=Candidatus Gottesmanbacteria bacterium RBG_16_43_7 TaxID=1798373 RepID=A0A1F5Z8J4_9BACT|nr:MAG: hypothetical protein A2154_01740 [Candidatus Gottesmanbacteria bacterium RBG_16_43_7]
MKNKTLLIFALLFIVGFLLRIGLSLLSESRIFWDMENYHQIALDILGGKLAAECCQKNNGYGLFLAGIYSLFGPNNLLAVRIVQSLIDNITAVLLYFSARRLVNRKAGIFTYIIYLFNPITFTYTGLRLPESLTIFQLALILMSMSTPAFRRLKTVWILLGFQLGLILFVRMQYFLFILGSTGLLSIFIFRKINRLLFLVLSAAGILLASSYTLVANYKTYNRIAINAPYHSFYLGLYQTFFMNWRYPELTRNYKYINPEYARIVEEYYYTPLPEKYKIEEKSKKLFMARIRQDYAMYTKNVIQNMIWIWDKDHPFYYEDPFYPMDTVPVRIFNFIILVLMAVGILSFVKKYRLKSLQNPIFLLSSCLIIYITVMFSLVSNESRHSISAYGVIVFWAGIGLAQIIWPIHVPQRPGVSNL